MSINVVGGKKMLEKLTFCYSGGGCHNRIGNMTTVHKLLYGKLQSNRELGSLKKCVLFQSECSKV